jgi:hypothetical protein
MLVVIFFMQPVTDSWWAQEEDSSLFEPGGEVIQMDVPTMAHTSVVRGLTPLFYQHVNPHGRFTLDLTQRLPLSTTS